MSHFALVFLFLASGLIDTGCTANPHAPTGSLLPQEASEYLLKHPTAQLVDVRTREEYAEGHIAGSKLIPVQELESRLGEIKKESPVLLYCRSGKRSRQAFDLLKNSGYGDLLEISGGITAWQARGLPVTAGAK